MRLADRSRAFRLSQPKALIGPVQATRYAGGLDSQKEFSSTLIFFEISPEKTTFDYAKRLKKSMKSGAFH